MEFKIKGVYTPRAEEAIKKWYAEVRKDFRKASNDRPELVIKSIYPTALWDDTKVGAIIELDLNDGQADI